MIKSPSTQTVKSEKKTRLVILNSEKINQHCSRANLLIHSRKTDPQKQRQIESNVNLFNQSIILSNEINKIFRELSSYGKLQYKESDRAECIVFQTQTVIDDLRKLQIYLIRELNEWKDQLMMMRQQYYILTFMPNQMIARLIYAEQQQDEILLEVSLRKLMKYKIIVFSPQEKEKLISESVQEKKLFERLQKIWEINEQNQLSNILIRSEQNFTQFSLQRCKTQFRYVPDDLQLIKAIISLFYISGVLPKWSDILFITEETQLNEVETFVLRALMATQKQTQKLFVMCNIQKLPFSVQSDLYDFIKKNEQIFHQNQYCLYAISTSKEIKQARLIEEIRCSQLFQQYIKEDQYKEFFKKFDHVKVVMSEQCGLGKSQFIKNLISKENKQILRIPIYGELKRCKLISLHQERIKHINDHFDIHYDVYPTSKEELNIVMFEAVILKCINQRSVKMIHLPQNSKIYIEMSNSLNDEFPVTFFTLLKRIELKWDFTNLKIGGSFENKVQKVCRYLHAIKENSNYSVQNLTKPKQLFSDLECQLLIKKYVSSKLSKPNFYYINCFIDFIYDQLTRMESSPYFQIENLERQMTGYFWTRAKANELHQEIVNQLIELSFKISIVEKFQDFQQINQNMIKISAAEEQANKFKDTQWDIYKNPFIVFNDSMTITPIFKNIEEVPKAIIEYQKRTMKKNKADNYFKQYDLLQQDEFIEKILEFCVDESKKEKLRKSKDLKSLVFTLDNFMKLVLIYLRIRAKQPIILMGETGVGKTSLVQYLANIIDFEFIVVNIHAGITEQEIIKQVNKAQNLAQGFEVQFVEESIIEERKSEGDISINQILKEQPQKQGKNIIIFFDEINTNINISGLLKEILIDRHCNGVPLDDKIRLVSACNPYKLRNKEISGLTSGLQYGSKDQSISRLVYRVLPLPDSMIPFIWDYKSLESQEEFKYIQKMIEKTFESGKIFGKKVNLINLWGSQKDKQKQESTKVIGFNDQINQIAQVIQNCQSIIKQFEECPWAVSLRDVQRFCKLFMYFFKNNSSRDKDKQFGSMKQFTLKKYSQYDLALVLSIYFCYVIRLKNQEERKCFLGLINRNIKIQALNQNNFKEIIDREQNRFMDEIEIKVGIGKSSTLKENIFVIITCILNEIPLIITGKPGSSKTLAMNLIIKSFKGKISTKSFFKKFPSFVAFPYQGSEQSTSDSILRIYKKAHKTQLKVKDKNEKVVVIFDEIGLAENSPHNPLKVLHSLLEPPKVAFVGISNWSLDASKMNRVINLSRTDPDNLDLFESAISIARDSHPLFKEKYLKSLVDWYISYDEKQSYSSKEKNFHGLRDFYSMIKFISFKINNDEVENEQVILKGIQRNFGGKNKKISQFGLDKFIALKNWEKLKNHKSDHLIKENLNDYQSRHLMVITDNFETSLQFIIDECQTQNRQYEIFYGSDFPDDQSEDSIYEQINEIILRMENGTLCVFLNLKNIYQSFYDMLNQNYQEIGEGEYTQRFCKVAIGPDSSKCLVHPNFKCVLIVDQSKVQELDPPLLNRFEKQLYTEEVSIDPFQKYIVNNLNEWIRDISKVGKFERKHMFPTIDEFQSIHQLIIQNRNIIGDNDELIIQECKRSLMRVASFQGVIRTFQASIPDKQQWIDEYLNDKGHQNLHCLLEQYVKDWQNDKVFSKTRGFNLLVYTYQALKSSIKSIKNIQIYDTINLNSIHKKIQFKDKVKNFFSDCNDAHLLIIQADLLTDSKNRINLCKSIINNQRTKRNLNCSHFQSEKHICFIVRIDSMKEDQSISFGKDWRQYTVDLLNGKGHSKISMKHIIKYDLETLLQKSCEQSNLFEQCLVEAMSKIYYKKGQEFIKNRIELIQKTFSGKQQNIEFLKDLILMKLKSDPNFENINLNWKQNIAMSEIYMGPNLTFHSAALQFIKNEIVKTLAFIINYLEQDGVVNAATNDDLFELAKGYFRILFKNNYLNIKIWDMYYLAPNFDLIQFPMALLIHKQYSQLKSQYLKVQKEQADIKYENKKVKVEFQVSESQIMLEENFDQSLGLKQRSSKMEQRERESIQNYKVFLIKDQLLQQNIEDLDQWCLVYFPQEFIDQQILTIDNCRYIKDLSYLNDSQEEYQQEDQNNLQCEYNKFIHLVMKLLMKENYISKSQIYGLFWKYENAIANVWSIISENIKLFGASKIFERLEQEIRNNEYFIKSEFQYFPRESFVESVIKIFYDLYYPTDNLKGKFNLWELNVKQTFQKLNDLASYYLKDFNTQQSRVLIFLLNFNHQLLKGKPLKIKEDIFIAFAKQIKDTINKPELVIREMKKILIEEWNSDQQRRIFKFICNFLVECFEEGNKIDQTFLLEDIIYYLIIPEEGLKELQNKENYQYLLNMLSKISIINTERKALKNVLIESQEEYLDAIKEFPDFLKLDQFLEKNKNYLRYSDPFIVAFSDNLSQAFGNDNKFSDQFIEDSLLDIKEILLSQQPQLQTFLKKLISFACFKRIIKIYANETILWLNGESFEEVELMSWISTFFDCESQNQRETLKPLAIYFLKEIYQNHDVIKRFSFKILEKNQWIKQYFDLSNSNYKFNSNFTQDMEFQKQLSIAKEKLFKPDELFTQVNINAEHKFIQVLAIIEKYYNDEKPLDKNEKYLNTQNPFIKSQITLDFLTPFFKGIFEIKRNGFIKIEENDSLYYFKVIQQFVGAAAISNEDSFLYMILNKPSQINDCYIPFIQNTKDGKEQIKNNDQEFVLQCPQCQNISNVIQLSNEKQDLSQMQYFGDFKCKVCLSKIDLKSINEYNRNIQSEFICDIQAQKSYIIIDFLNQKDSKLRSLNMNELLLGRILLHSLLMVALSFTNSEADLFNIILNKEIKQEDYKINLENTLIYLGKCFNNDWKKLKERLQINDEKVLQLVQFLIYKIVKIISKFKCVLLKSTEGRKEIEKLFSELCKPIIQNLDQFFKQDIGYQNPIEIFLMEQNEQNQNDWYPLFRIQREIKFEHFEQFTKSNFTTDSEFFKILIDQKESLQQIHYLKPLIQWAKYIFTKWNTQITYDEAQEWTIKDIIDKEEAHNFGNKEYILKIKQDFCKFQEAWNQFEGLVLTDKNVQVVIPHMSQNSKLIHCCLTKDKFQQNGHTFYLLLKYLSQKQNNLLEGAQKLFKQNQINSIAFPKTSILNLRKEAIVYFRDKTQQKLKRKDTIITHKQNKLTEIVKEQSPQHKIYEIEQFEQIIIENSTCNLSYGQGKQVKYYLDKIKNNLIEVMLKGKYIIDYTDQKQKLNFQFVDIGNLYSQILEVQKTIKQEKFSFIKELVKQLGSDQDLYVWLQDLKTVLNFLYQSAEDPDYSLLLYCRQLKLNNFSDKLAGQFYSTDLKIKHVINFYETIEKKVWYILVQNITETYKTDLENDQADKIRFILSQDFFLINDVRKALAKICVRLLSFQQSSVRKNDSLFRFLFCDDNKFIFSQEADLEIYQLIFQSIDLQMIHTYQVFQLFTQQYNHHKLKIKNQDQYERSRSYTNQSNNQSNQSFYMNMNEEKDQIIRQSISEMSHRYSSIFDMQEFEKKPKRSKVNRMIEEFFIIGPNLDQINLDYLNSQQCLHVEAKNYYLFREKSEKTSDQRKLLVSQFCFPNGSQVKIADNQSIQDVILEQSTSYSQKNSFIFTVQAQGDDSFDEDLQQYYFCICIIKDELMELGKGKNKIKVIIQKAYVVMSLYKYFDFHLQVLNSIFSLYKVEKLKMSQALKKDIYSDKDREIEVQLKIPLICSDIVKLLDNYMKMHPKQQELNIEMPVSGDKIQYKTPLLQIQLELTDLYWYTPLFLQILKSDQFQILLCSLLLERSIIFIADSLPMLTSASIGMQCFIEPFSWCHTQIPILPKNLLEVLQAPSPYITGILRSYESEVEWEEITNPCIIVDIRENTNSVEITPHGDNLCIPSFNNLVFKLDKQFDIINIQEQQCVEIGNLEQKNAIKKIFQFVKYSLREAIINKISIQNKKTKFKNVDEIKLYLIESSQEQDKQFIQQFVETQMFAYYLDQSIKKFNN